MSPAGHTSHPAFFSVLSSRYWGGRPSRPTDRPSRVCAASWHDSQLTCRAPARAPFFFRPNFSISVNFAFRTASKRIHKPSTSPRSPRSSSFSPPRLIRDDDVASVTSPSSRFLTFFSLAVCGGHLRQRSLLSPYGVVAERQLVCTAAVAATEHGARGISYIYPPSPHHRL